MSAVQRTFSKILVLCLLVTAFGQPVFAAEGAEGNVVPDPGFESGTLQDWNDADPVKNAVVADSVYSGVYSLKQSGTWAAIYRNITLEPNTTYSLSGIGKAVNGSGVLKVKVVNGDWAEAPGAELTFRDADYTALSGEFTTPGSIAYAQVQIYTPQSDAFYIDDIEVKKAQLPAVDLPTLEDGVFQVNGTEITGPDGEPYVIKGVNVNGPNSWWPREITQDADLIENWGFNSVRVNACIHNCGWQNNNNTDRIVSAFTSKRMVVMFEAHDQTGEFFTETSTPSLAELTAWWTDLANKYKNNPYVWFNIMNEPGTDTLDPQWLSMHRHVVEAIRATGATNVIMADGMTWGQDSGKSKAGDVQVADSAILSYGSDLKAADPLGNMVFSIHTYGGWEYSNDKFQHFVEAVHAKGLALIVGEYGATTKGQFLEGTKNVFKYGIPNGIGRMVWSWDGGDDWELTTNDASGGGGWGINTDGTVKPTNLTWFGEKVWNDNHNIPMTMTDRDVSVERVLVSKADFAAGDTVRFQAALRNRGDELLEGDVAVRFEVNGAAVEGGTTDAPVTIDGYASAVSGEFTVPADVENLEVKAWIDRDSSTYGNDAVAANDEETVSFQGALEPYEGVDLVVSDIQVSPENLEYGSQAEFQVTVTNRGTEDARNDWIAGAFYVDGLKVTWGGEETALAAGESVTLTSVAKYKVKGPMQVSFQLDPSVHDIDTNLTNEGIFASIAVKEANYGNLLPNGQFETGLEDWTLWANTEGSSADAHTGAQSLKVRNGGAGGGGSYVDLEPNTTYVLSAWGRNSGAAGATSDVGFQYKPNVSSEQTKFFLHFEEKAWTHKQIMFTTGPQVLEGSGNVFVWKQDAEVEFYLDDIVLAKVPNLLLNSGFEAGEEDWMNWAGRTIDSAAPRTGANAFKIASGGAGGGGQELTLKPNTTYMLSAYGMNSGMPDGGPTDIGVKYKVMRGGVESVPHHFIHFDRDNKGIYEYNQVMFTTPGDFTNAQLFIWKQTPGVEFFADDLVLTEVPNQLLNAGFEEGETGWSNWSNRTIAETGALSGDKAFKVSAAGSGGGGQDIQLEPETTYVLGAWAKHSVASNDVTEIGVQYKDAGAQQIKHLMTFSGTAYEYKEILFTTPKYMNGTNVFIWKNGQQAELLADDLILTKVPSTHSNPAQEAVAEPEPVAIVVEGIEDNGLYNAAKTISFNTGTAALNGENFVSGTTVSAEGTHTLVVTGNVTKTVKFTLDFKPPILTGVLEGNMYKKSVAPTFSEGTALLDGVAYASGTPIQTDGLHRLVLTDAAGNATTVNFTVKGKKDKK
ncbi:carbohydrate binding domain-containing protein [Paenibacillus swuensis]|nr:carbohydrate binding domain-containing protein [Paenibacillus swuensis]